MAILLFSCFEKGLNFNSWSTIAANSCETLKVMGDKSEKCLRIMQDQYGIKEYLVKQNIHKARQLFRTRTRMQNFAGNYSHDRRFAGTGWLCRCGLEREQVSHLTSGTCPTYRDIFLKYEDLTGDEDLARFFGEVLARRDSLDSA